MKDPAAEPESNALVMSSLDSLGRTKCGLFATEQLGDLNLCPGSPWNYSKKSPYPVNARSPMHNHLKNCYRELLMKLAEY